MLGGWTFAFRDYIDRNFTAQLDNPATQLMADINDPIGESLHFAFAFEVLHALLYHFRMCIITIGLLVVGLSLSMIITI